MNKKVGTIVAIVIILGLVVGVVSMNSNKSKDKNKSTVTNSNTSQDALPDSTTQIKGTGPNTIEYNSTSGFNPATLTVKAGSTITIKNISSQVMEFNSAPHPEHTEDPELNIGGISPGQSKTITVTKTGPHIYHNNLSPNDSGILVVE